MAPPGPYLLRLDAGELRVLLGKWSGPWRTPQVGAALGQAIRKWGVMVQTRAVYNVTGHPVSYEGGFFVVRVRTGALRGAIELQWPFHTNLQARVFVNGSAMNPGEKLPGGVSHPRPVSVYAASIEFGHDEIDLKKTMLGKTVPFFGVKSKSNGPYAATELKPVNTADTDYGSKWRSAQLDAKLAAKSKGPMSFTKMGSAKISGSTYFIAFRKVGKVGWIIPAAAPRPFMRAALEGTRDQGRRMVVRDLAEALRHGAH